MVKFKMKGFYVQEFEIWQGEWGKPKDTKSEAFWGRERI